MDGPAIISAGGATPVSPTSPVSARYAPNGPPKRKHSSMALDSSPGSNAGHDDENGEPDSKKRQPGVKRACNECRQQKVSHLVFHNIGTSLRANKRLIGTVAMRCCPRSLPELFPVQSPQA